MPTTQRVKPHHLDLTYTQYLQKKRLLTGCKIGKYLISQKIGEGAFGSVFKGINEETKQFVAIKVLDLFAVEDQKSQYVKRIRKRLIRTQAEMMIKCNSDHLIKCYDIFENKALRLMIIQFCNNGNLDDQINLNKLIPEEDAIKILIQILNGLAELHKNSIVHRDLKPQNIMINDGTYKIGDFGFSKELGSNNFKNQLKQTKLGTIYTMAPQVMEGKNYGLQADIWSIGVIFYNMLSGKIPYISNSYKEVVLQIKNKKNIFEKVNKNIQISNQAKKFISQCLQYNSQKRLNWNNIINHELFKKYIKSSLKKTMRRDIALDVQNMEDLDKTQIVINDQVQNANERSPQSKSQLQQVVLLDSRYFDKKKAQVQQLYEDSVFSWSKAAHFQCLKTELILKDIIEPLQMCKEEFLEKREIIQILYLLVARCFNNISLKKFESRYQKQKIVVDLMRLIQNLHKKVQQKFNLYSKALSKKQSEMIQIVKDKFLTLFKKDSIVQKDRFLTGIQSNELTKGRLQSYTKLQQIQFTQRCLNQQQNTFSIQETMSSKTKNFMKNYEKICNLTLKKVGDQYFRTHVEHHFEKN